MAFKEAAVVGSPWAKLIAEVTGGKFSHVEVAFGDPKSSPWCYSSREGTGCSMRVINLAVPGLWECVQVPLTTNEEMIALGYARAMSAARIVYDYFGDIGVGAGTGWHNPHGRFCSNTAAELLQIATQERGSSQLLKGIPPWAVAPSGPAVPGRWGLYELVKVP